MHSLYLTCALIAHQALASLGQNLIAKTPLSHPHINKNPDHSIYQIPNTIQNKPSKVQFDIPTLGRYLNKQALWNLDAPQVNPLNGSVFDWWYFDAVSETNSNDSLVVTFFTSSFAAFPYLRKNESSVVTVWLWASFANGTVFGNYVPATVATVSGGYGVNSSGEWSSTGFGWNAPADDLSKYEVVVASEKMQVKGKLTLTSRVPYHLPCGVQAGRSTLEVAPHIGWVNLVPDAVGEVDISIHGSRLKFHGAGYHDKNWSDRPFMDSVQSWYWGHGRLGPYSIVWFSYFALNDPTNTTYVSSYVAKDGKVLVSACDPSLLTVRPVGRTGTTGGRYPPRVGDIPEAFRLEFDLGEVHGRLAVNVSMKTVVAGDKESYMRWTADMVGEIVEGGGQQPQDLHAVGSKRHMRQKRKTETLLTSDLAGVGVLEQFVMVE
ncbi:hypothetical protein N7457_002846 [Penicillium paradoxum]|uniref:uncharacterized protein n=1 Tax=Penicillium paradoxum TaxID=176176 RepID=UPI002548BB51|nr:uncharacterized protein N7457_002846 [Penicillium paradoxum]KAJ5787856.1 hypothetical protein N7457_002846 [Penicillium paradoxum]